MTEKKTRKPTTSIKAQAARKVNWALFQTRSAQGQVFKSIQNLGEAKEQYTKDGLPYSNALDAIAQINLDLAEVQFYLAQAEAKLQDHNNMVKWSKLHEKKHGEKL